MNTLRIHPISELLFVITSLQTLLIFQFGCSRYNLYQTLLKKKK